MNRKTLVGAQSSHHFQTNTGLVPQDALNRPVIFHKSYGLINFRFKDVVLYSFEDQRSEIDISLDMVMYTLESRDFVILGRSVLDLFLLHDYPVPANWGICNLLYFVGDIYQASKRNQLVYGLCAIESDRGNGLKWKLIEKKRVNQTPFSRDDKFAVLVM